MSTIGTKGQTHGTLGPRDSFEYSMRPYKIYNFLLYRYDLSTVCVTFDDRTPSSVKVII